MTQIVTGDPVYIIDVVLTLTGLSRFLTIGTIPGRTWTF